jgi:hypothetical protein
MQKFLCIQEGCTLKYRLTFERERNSQAAVFTPRWKQTISYTVLSVCVWVSLHSACTRSALERVSEILVCIKKLQSVEVTCSRASIVSDNSPLG